MYWRKFVPGLSEENMRKSTVRKKLRLDNNYFRYWKKVFSDKDNLYKDFNMKNVRNDLDRDERNNMNGYEGLFGNFNCLRFFNFENIFDIRKRENMNDGYSNFRDNILTNFTKYKNKL